MCKKFKCFNSKYILYIYFTFRLFICLREIPKFVGKKMILLHLKEFFRLVSVVLERITKAIMFLSEPISTVSVRGCVETRLDCV